MMSNDLVNKDDQVPDYLRDSMKKERIGNLDESDRIVPRLQLLQAISPEVTDYDNAKAGCFWHNLAAENLGDRVKAIPIIVRKSVILWAPRGDDRGILARSMDCVNWDNPNMEFQVKLKGVAKPVVWATRDNVKDSGLLEFGSSTPGDSNSNPAASLTYNTMWYLVDHPEYSPVVVINTRSSLKPTQQLYNRIEMRPVAHYAQLWELGVSQEKGAEGPYFNYTYRASGYPDQNSAEAAHRLYDRFKLMEWAANDETDKEAAPPRTNGSATNEDMASKF
jgi:hypothetical protein